MLELDDIETDTGNITDTDNGPQLISGFISLVRIYLCAVDLISDRSLGSPRYKVATSSVSSITSASQLESPFHTEGLLAVSHWASITFEAGMRVSQDLNRTIQLLPEQFKPLNTGGRHVDIPLPFSIARVSISMTKVYIQSIILATLSAALPESSSSHLPCSGELGQLCEGSAFQGELLKLGLAIAQESSDALSSTPVEAVEANGIAMVSLKMLHHYGAIPTDSRKCHVSDHDRFLKSERLRLP